jgi:hypothetical protein
MMTNKQAWHFSRRTLLATSIVLASEAKAETSRLERDVRHYVRFGIHRAGTIGERRTANWLRNRLLALGYQARIEPFPIKTILEPSAIITINNQTIAAFPQWFPPAACLNHVTAGPLLPLEAESDTPAVRIVSQPALLLANWDAPLDALVAQAVQKQATALILSINDPSDDLFVCNQHHKEPFPIPVLLVARRDLSRLLLLATPNSGQVQIGIKGRLVDTNALNVVGFKPGVGKTVVISTPLTGWFQCGGERGPGVALWLHIAQLLAAQSRPVLMLGTGSHEIGHKGMEHALAHNVAPKPDDVALWVHFGASLAANRLDSQYSFTTRQFLVGTDVTEAGAKLGLGSLMPIFVMGTPATLGEAGQVIGAGHRRFVGLSGQFPTFHTPLDQGQAIDFGRLDQLATAAGMLIQRIAGVPD